MLRLILPVCAILIGTAPAIAQEETPGFQNPEGLIKSLDVDTIEPVLIEAGINPQRRDVQGSASLVLTDPKGQEIILQPTACDDDGCLGLLLLARPEVSRLPSIEIVMQYNANINFATAVINSQTLWLRDYLTADYGITRGNLVVEIILMFSALEQWQAPAPAPQ